MQENHAELQQIIRMSKDYNLVPISRTLLADTETPIRVFQHFYDEPYAFLLESVEGGVDLARYSFIGTNPFMVVRGKRGQLVVERQGQEPEVLTDKPVESLRKLLKNYSSPVIPELPRFTGGAVGFFGYDLLQYYENIPSHASDDLDMEDLEFMFCDQVIAFDHVKQQIKLIANVHIPDSRDEQAIQAAYEQTVQRIDATMKRLQSPQPADGIPMNLFPDDVELGEIQSNVTKAQYMANVEKAKEYIRCWRYFPGGVIAALRNVNGRFSTACISRAANDESFALYVLLKLDDEVIVGTSPEMLVRVEGERVETRPIAGTRPRGKTEEEDRLLEQDLLADEKERAEHLC